MKAMPRLALYMACGIWGAAACPLAAQMVIRDVPETTTAPASLEWQTSPDAALAEAREASRPVVMIFGAAWCTSCRELAEDIEKPQVQAKLSRMTRVYVDFDKNRDLAKKYGVGPIPALRVLRSNGRVIAVQDGYMRAERLVGWLEEAQQAAAAPGADVIVADDVPTADAVAKALGAFADPEPETREAAIRRLLPYPGAAAAPVTQAFKDGSLAARLTALDLLESWKAPVGGLDPWRPETVTKERLEALAAWSANPVAPPAASEPVLSEQQLADARELIDQVLAAGDAEVPALRERLARYGPPLLPTIYAALKNPPSDKARERLTQVRYRLASSDALAVAWPAGLERLASAQIKVRHSALDELGKRASPKDALLLLELFSDPDPLVRETSLRLMQQVGGPSALDALANLLRDPDPNVRAAVLKSVEEKPSAVVTARIAAYTEQERDPDLLVHAARVLRKTPLTNLGKPLAALYRLLGHENWRVRSEAAESLTELVGHNSEVQESVKADFFARMVLLLEDADGFVASKAMLALERASLVPDLQKVVGAAMRHPELATQAVKILAASTRTNPKAADLIRGFLGHKDPAVRAVTIVELAAALGEAASGNLQTALHDPDARVRIAAEGAIFAYLASRYPSTESNRYSSTPTPPPDLEKFLADFGSGKTRPGWLESFHADLDKALTAEAPEERLKAAQCLIAYGDREKALTVITALVAENPAFVDAATYALPWLPWTRRLELFNTLLKKDNGGNLSALTRSIAVGDEPRSIESLWAILAHPKASYSTAEDVATYLRNILVGSSYRSEEMGAARKKQLLEAVGKVLDHGNDLQKVVALSLLHSSSPKDAADAAVKIHDDPAASAQLRCDAFQVQLALLAPAAGQARAVEALNAKNELERKLAMRFLAEGPDTIRSLHESIYLGSSGFSSEDYSSGTPIVPKPPRGVTVEILKPLLKDKDAELAADAAAVLALLGDGSGMEQLLAWYKDHRGDRGLTRMVYRAVAVLNDESYTPLLADMYQQIGKDSYDVREFYWTIRSMTGEKLMALRKQIRTESGMDRLR